MFLPFIFKYCYVAIFAHLRIAYTKIKSLDSNRCLTAGSDVTGEMCFITEEVFL